jgi:Lipase (class 3)
MDPIPYSAAREDVFHPCARGDFFPVGLPVSDAGTCAEMCRLAYCRAQTDFSLDQAKINGVLDRAGYRDAQYFETQGSADRRGMHGFLARSKGEGPSVLVFRGTDSDDPSDLVADGRFLFTQWEAGGRVHRGFADALAEVRPQLEQLLPTIDAKLLITGHSLGAGLATLLASAWSAKLAKGWELYTYGCPRAGDGDFVATIEAGKAHRYVDCCDAVTRVPPEAFGYVHAGTLAFIDHDGVVRGDSDDAFVNSERLKGTEEYLLHYFAHVGTVATRDLADHAPINYVSGVTGTRAGG